MQDWSQLRFLLVEDSATMRVWLKNSIIGMGGKSVDHAVSYSDALYRIGNRDESNPRTQQMLEWLRLICARLARRSNRKLRDDHA